MNAKDFLMVGDSWGLGMKKYFPTNTSIVSSGLFTRGGLPSAADQIKNANYSNGVIIVHSGGNDIGMRGPKKNGKSLVTDDVKQTINAAKAKGCKVIFVAAPWLNHTSTNVTGNRDKYNSWLKEAALANGAGYIDTAPMLSYMQQHQPQRGNFHLNNYSGYADYILKEAQKMSSTNIKPIYNATQSTRRVRKKPKRINNFGGYPAWGKMYTDVQDLLQDHKVNMNIVNQIIQACKNNGLSLNQTAVILGNAFQESRFKTSAKNNISGGHNGVWQFSTAQYDKFGLSNWNTQLRYLMEEVAKTPEYQLKDKQGKIKRWISPHIGGNGWRGRHKAVWDTSNDIEKLAWAFGEGWERYGHPEADTDSRTQLSKLFQQYLINTNFGTTAYTPKVQNDTTPTAQVPTSENTLNAQQDIQNNFQTDSTILNTEPNYINPAITENNFNKTFFPIIDTELKKFSDYTINDVRKGKYSTVDYYSILTDFLQNNTNKFQKGGTILSSTDIQTNKLQVPTYNTLDYAEIINKVWNNSDGFIKPDDTPVTFGNNIDFTKFSISPTDIESSTNQDVESAEQSSKQDTDNQNLIQDTDNQNLEKIDQTFQQLDFNTKQYSTKDLDNLFGTNLQNILKGEEFDYSKLTQNDSIVLQKLLNTIQNDSKINSGNISNHFDKDLIDLLVAFDMFDKSDNNGNIPNRESYSLFEKKSQQSEDSTQHKKGGIISMGHPKDTNYEDDIYYNPPKENKVSNKNKKNNSNKKVSLGHPKDTNYEDDIYYNPTIETKPTGTTIANPIITEQKIIPVESQQVNSPSNQTSTTINNYSNDNQPVNVESNTDLQYNNYLSFAQAFKQARNLGLPTFTWKGKLYTTQLAKRPSRRKIYIYRKNRRR